MRYFLSALLCALLVGTAQAASLSGTWVLSAEGRTALVLTIAKDGATAQLRKPRDAIFHDGRTISGMKPGIDDRQLEVTERNAKPE